MTVVLTAFEKGTYVIPALTIEFPKGKVLKTEPIKIEVRTVTVDTSKDIKDVKPPLEVPFRLRDALPYILIAVAAGLLTWAIFHVLKKRKKQERILPAPPQRPAHELALEALRKLEAERLWQNGKIKDYHSKLTDIIRTYVDRRYDLPAMEMTSEDILSSDRILLLSDDLRKQIEEILTLADLVKFAKFLPDPAEHENVLRFATSFVQATSTAGFQVAMPTRSPKQKLEITG